MARQLSFAGVTFEIRELPLAVDFVEMYNSAVSLVSCENSFMGSVSWPEMPHLDYCGILYKCRHITQHFSETKLEGLFTFSFFFQHPLISFYRKMFVMPIVSSCIVMQIFTHWS